MSKRERKQQHPEKNKVAEELKPLLAGLELFQQGDYVRARPLVREGSKDPTISETQRAFARSVLDAMRLDRITLLVGFACVLLALLVVATTAFLQP